MTKFELDYADSRFGFLTPQKIVITNYSRGRTGADKLPELLLGGKITFEYGASTRVMLRLLHRSNRTLYCRIACLV